MKITMPDGKSFWIDKDEYDKQLAFTRQKQMEAFKYRAGFDPYNDVDLDMDKIEKGPKLKLDINKKEL